MLRRERRVVDTNVLVVANGRGTHVDEECKLRCTDALLELRNSGIAVLDNQGMILEEYRRYANVGGQKGVGDVFFKYLVDRRYLPNAGVECVNITPVGDESRGFAQLPANLLDPSDRKFLAVAVVADASILNATDSDWNDQSELLDELSVTVEQLCPAYAVRRVVPGHVREGQLGATMLQRRPSLWQLPVLVLDGTAQRLATATSSWACPEDLVGYAGGTLVGTQIGLIVLVNGGSASGLLAVFVVYVRHEERHWENVERAEPRP